jgi:beta-ureidopropionase / N-carbamoyl-L-amino-acid hydrolase
MNGATLSSILEDQTLAFGRFAQLGRAEAASILAGLYEHSDWIVEAALQDHPFTSLAALKYRLVAVVSGSSREQRLALIRAHPPLSAKAKIDESIAKDSRSEQSLVGLDRCSPEEFEALTTLNAQYLERFGWPFILAVKGPRGLGLSRAAIIASLRRRLAMPAEEEFEECLRQIHRIAEMRLDERLGLEPVLGNQVWDACEELAKFSEDTDGLTVTYLSEAHKNSATLLRQQMQSAGFDEVFEDLVGNVVGVYKGGPGQSGSAVGACKRLMTGSHYDTVRNGGKYDGRIGIQIPIVVIAQLKKAGIRLPFDLEVIGFSEEEGVRFKCTFLGSGAVAGKFDLSALGATDGNGVSLDQALQAEGRIVNPDSLKSIAREPSDYLGFVEIHIEQGPVLAQQGLPLGAVTSINGSARYMVEIRGLASHAGTTPMTGRRDAAAAAAEFMVALEQAAQQMPDCVATVGQLQVVNGSTNVVPGRVTLSLDLRAPTNHQRDELVQKAMALLEDTCRRRGVDLARQQTLLASAAPSAPGLQAAWEASMAQLGLPIFRLPSGAGHDAMKLHEVMPQAMLFVRGENLGISHNPLESSTNHDLQLGCEVFLNLLAHLSLNPHHPNA